jgi:hypothetical protein
MQKVIHVAPIVPITHWTRSTLAQGGQITNHSSPIRSFLCGLNDLPVKFSVLCVLCVSVVNVVSYRSTVTGVPSSTLLKKICAILPGIRMQPCDAGYPGR